jgi:hypothetical protein
MLEKGEQMIKKQVASRDELLTNRISQHFREFHAADSATLRRTFLRSAAGLAGLGLSSGFCLPKLAQAAPNDENDDNDKNVLPKPIPGGVSPLGIFIHHFPVTPTATPLQNLTDPSQITDFQGLVGLNRIRGAGRGKGFPTLAFQADMGFMKGLFIGVDGKRHHGAFCFI